LPPDREQAAQFDDRFGMVVDAKIACAIDAFSGARGRAKLLDDKRSRLLPPAVTPCRLPRFKRRHHPLRERRRRLDERAPHRRKDVGTREHVSLHREPLLNLMARPLDAVPPGERRGTPISGYGSQLTQFPISIVSKRLIECHRRINVPS
jgi:hypothetical protein